MSADRRFEIEVEAAATPEQAWEAIATGPGITAWFMPAEVEGRIGGSIVHRQGEEMASSGTVIAYDPPAPLRLRGGRVRGLGGNPPTRRVGGATHRDGVPGRGAQRRDLRRARGDERLRRGRGVGAGDRVLLRRLEAGAAFPLSVPHPLPGRARRVGQRRRHRERQRGCGVVRADRCARPPGPAASRRAHRNHRARRPSARGYGRGGRGAHADAGARRAGAGFGLRRSRRAR